MALVALSLGFWACDRTTDPAPAPGGEMSVGLVLPLTGHLAATGQLMKQGFDLALDEINAAPRPGSSSSWRMMPAPSRVRLRPSIA